MIFWTKFAQKGCFRSKNRKSEEAIEFCIFDLVWVPNFSLNWQFWFFFSYQICPKREFLVENGKIALVRTSMVFSYYIKLFHTVADRHNDILMSLLLLVAETIGNIKIDLFFLMIWIIAWSQLLTNLTINDKMLIILINDLLWTTIFLC